MKKGFTLVEVMAAIIVLSIVSIIAIPRIMDTIERSRYKSFYIEENKAIKAASEYFNQNSGLLYNIGDAASVSINTLISEGKLKEIQFYGDTCGGYILGSKVKENEVIYTSHINCKSTVNSLSEDDLIGYFNLDNNIYNLANPGGVSTQHGNISFGEDKFENNKRALYLDGSAQSYILSDVTRPTTTLSICAWINPDILPSERMTIVQGVVSSSYYLSLHSNGAINSYWYDTSSPGYHSTPASIVNVGEWTHACTTWDGTSNRIYVNGSLENTRATSGIGRNTTRVNIGAASSARRFIGFIDDVYIYDRTLSDEEIMFMYKKRLLRG